MVFYYSFLARTDPRDVARVESKTYICTEDKRESIPTAKEGAKGQLGNWMNIEAMNKELSTRFPGCMIGRFINVIETCNPILISEKKLALICFQKRSEIQIYLCYM